MTSPEVVLTRHGYYELASKPEPEELSKYYADKYYQQSIRTHQHQYDEAEIRFRHAKLEQKRLKVEELLGSAEGGRFLDVGAGEAFAMKHFHDAGWQVTGLDYSSFGCKTHHPVLIGNLITGDVSESLLALAGRGEKYDLVLLDNVLEHVLDPLAIMDVTRQLLTPTGILIVEVPNDFSRLQMQLLDSGRLPAPFWVVAPDHISYFNAKGLTLLGEEAGLVRKALMSDFPIDFFLVNEHTNYATDKTKGKACHKSRVELDLLMHDVSPRGANAFYEALGALGMGRQIIAFFQLKSC